MSLQTVPSGAADGLSAIGEVPRSGGAEFDIISPALLGHPPEPRLEVPFNGAISPTSPPTTTMSAARGATVIVTLIGVTFLNSMGTGILIAALPRIAKDVGLNPSLILWPAVVYAVAAGSLLLVFGAVADVVGAKRMWLAGSVLFAIFTVAVGFSRTGGQIILFRTLLGVAISMCLPTSVALITNSFPRGPWRIAAFAINGASQVLGFALGAVLGGILTDTIGWRWAYYLMALINFCLSAAAVWSMPDVRPHSEKRWTDVDWLGAFIMSVALGLLLYVLAVTTSSYHSIGDAQNIVLLVVSVCLLAAFPLWMRRQAKKGGPALIPNELWRNASFTSVCVSVFLSWASLTCMEYYLALYFQQVQGLPALQSSIRFMPNVVSGSVLNVLTGYLISRVKVRTLAVASALAAVVAPVLMATIDVGDNNYWFAPFWSMLLSPMSADVLFTISNLVISDAFPAEVQSLAGGVFNEVAQFGNSVGLAVSAAIAASVTEHSHLQDPKDALMEGYRAAFWTIFASSGLVVFIAFFGLRKGGTVGKKHE